MYFSSLSFRSFRNYEQTALNCGPGLICLYGPNGAGKTNFLDALHYLCTARSAFFSEDATLVKEGADHFVLQGQLHMPEISAPRALLVSYEKNKKKQCQVDRQYYRRRSDYALHAPVLMLAPNDISLVEGSAQGRRDFIDALLMQEDADYRKRVSSYKGYLRARNAVLRSPLEGKQVDKVLLMSYDERLLPLAHQIAARRAAFLAEYLPMVQEKYASLAGHNEEVSIQYSSEVLSSNFSERYSAALEEDIRLMRTQMGIHRDDYVFLLREKPLRSYASQGQQKTFLWALKLSHAQRLYQLKKRMPILLLDDIFDKLDPTRRARLFELLLAQEGRTVPLSELQLFLSSPQPPPKDLLPCSPEELHLVHIENGSLRHK